MSAPEGNQFWKLRSKHGRDKLFASPELLWEAACEYFEWCEENPFHEVKPMSVSQGMNSGSSIEMVEIPVKRPFTLHGVCRYLDCNTGYFRDFRATIKDVLNDPRSNADIDLVKDFSAVIQDIEETIYDQKFSGAASGFFNANIISRDLGLTDKQEHKHNIQRGVLNNDPLADDTANDSPAENIKP